MHQARKNYTHGLITECSASKQLCINTLLDLSFWFLLLVFSVSNISLLPYPGAVIVAQPLDYETCRDYFLTVEARDGGTPPLSAITTVNINLTDVNDNAPMFSYDRYTAVLSEDSNLEEFVVQVGLGPILFCMETVTLLPELLLLTYNINHLKRNYNYSKACLYI